MFSSGRLASRLLNTDSRKSPTRILFLLPSLTAMLFLASCASTPSQSTQPPKLTYATTNAVYTKGTAITPNTPTNGGGAAASYAVTPALPAGLSLNTTTGVISGTPTAVAAQATYTATASNAGGSSSFGLSITVNDVAPSGLSYSVNPAVYAAAASISPDVPNWSVAGGTPTSFAVVGPPLPQGLSLDTATGVISGTPAAQTAQASYTISASNTGGSTSTTLTLTVIPQAPYITVQPASQYVGSGISTSFAVGANGGGILSFQWYKNGAAVGTNSDVYTTPILSSADSGEQFDVVVSDNYSRSATSNAATLTIKGVSGTFVNTGTPSTARNCHTATLLQNGKVLVAGGRNGNTALASAELYDPSTGVFTGTGSLTTERCDHSATLLQNGKVLVAGGYNIGGNGGSPVLASAELYDPGTGTFFATGSLGGARSGHSATLLVNGKVLVAGGTSSNDGFAYFTIASAELYDPVAGTFSATGSLNTARSTPAALLNNGQVLFAGGSNISLGALASAEIYDPTAATFTVTGSLITARGNHSSTLLQNGKVLVAGGDNSGGVTFLASAELYDPSAGTFTATGALNYAREIHTGTLLPNGQVLIAGGDVAAVMTIDSIIRMTEIYDPASGLFILNAPTNSDRFFLSATLLSNGQVLITGQETSAIGGGNTFPSEIYKP